VLFLLFEQVVAIFRPDGLEEAQGGWLFLCELDTEMISGSCSARSSARRRFILPIDFQSDRENAWGTVV
jgi:hypothetical protein